MHICNSKKLREKGLGQFGNISQIYVVTLIISGDQFVATVQYYARAKNTAAGGLHKLSDFGSGANSNDEFHNARFKLIPTIVDGPWVIRRCVDTTPCIVLKAIKSTYYLSPNYLEVV
ncbi:hypothetical protein PHMEG_00019337 [Phytophthora megakarya]|uniref:Protein ENHANCED DISEASE RESISTANCE 2 C-terminal domain-containing protein n=1 Tax=Phytophthora megakarya TaxID=4795 RepID=A0A225VS63_9STRA|nr:hypothetical protein PHMEG_00019337 [Phytophthora megakarya]